MISEFDRGTAITIEIQFKALTPHSGYALSDVTTPRITVWAPDESKIVDNQSLTNSATGKYYYNIQTTKAFLTGQYRAEISGIIGSITGIKAINGIFKLK